MPAELDEITRRVTSAGDRGGRRWPRRTTRRAEPGSTSCARSWPTCAPRPTPCGPSGRPSGRPSGGSRSCAGAGAGAARGRGGRAQLRPQPRRRTALRPARRARAPAAGRGGAAGGSRASAGCCARWSPTRRSPRSSRAGPASRSARLQEGEREKLLRLDEILHERVVGQDEAVQAGRRRDHPGPVGHQGPAPADRLVHLPRPHRRRQDRAGQAARRGAVRRRGQHRPPRHERVPGAAHRSAGWSAPRPATSATRRAASSPRRCGASPYSVVLFDEIEKAHPTCSTRCCRSWTTAGSPTPRAGRSTSATRSSS